MLERSECRQCGEFTPHVDLVCWHCGQGQARELRTSAALQEAVRIVPVHPASREMTPPKRSALINRTPSRWWVATALSTVVFLAGYWLGKEAAPPPGEPRLDPAITSTRPEMGHREFGRAGF